MRPYSAVCSRQETLVAELIAAVSRGYDGRVSAAAAMHSENGAPLATIATWMQEA